MQNKIRVLVIVSDRTGVGAFRSIKPHTRLQELYNDEFFVDIITAGTDTFSWDDSFIQKYDIVHFHRTLPMITQRGVEQVYMEPVWNLIEKIRSLGVITIMDLDDYWMVGQEHPMYKMVKQSEMDVKIKNNIKRVDYLTTTTPIFANEISKLNKNVVVLPNAIDPNEYQYSPNPEKTNKKLRVGWLGGSSHEHDLNLIYSSVSQFLNDHKEDTQFVLCGFDTRGNITEINQKTGEQKMRKIRPIESVWYRYEYGFTDNHRLLNEDYKSTLLKFDRDLDESYNSIDEVYRRMWTKPITTYATNYNHFDVSLAPLKETIFNKVKSQLKVIEAGFHKKALIAQDFGPYQIDLVNVFEKGGKVNENGNAILVPSDRNHKEWGRGLKRLYENPEIVELISNNLFNTVNEKYHIDVVTKQRAEFYKQVVKDNKKEIKEFITEING
jgi:glycosyltransferase involved in cell wall biosynthesis